jgi:hypothetical protein
MFLLRAACRFASLGQWLSGSSFPCAFFEYSILRSLPALGEPAGRCRPASLATLSIPQALLAAASRDFALVLPHRGSMPLIWFPPPMSFVSASEPPCLG